MDFLTHNLLPFFGIFLAILVIHESGHYFTAKLFGVKVLEAGIGLPPRVWGFTWRGTDYTLNALPFGAFVRMLGEEDPEDPQSLAARPKWKRTVIIGSGAALNVLLAVVLFMVGLMIPREVADGGAQIAHVVPDSPAQRAGLQEGDEILKVNGRSIDNTGDAIYIVRLSQGSDVDFTIKRTDARTGNDEILKKTAYARWDPPEYVDECGVERGTGMTGIVLAPEDPGGQVTLTEEERRELEKDGRAAYRNYVKQVAPGSPAHCYSPTDYYFRGHNEAQCSAFDPELQAQMRALKNEAFPNAPNPCYEFRAPLLTEQPTKTVSYPVWDAAPRSIRLSFEHLILTRNQIWKLARGFESAPLAGPVGLAHATGEIVEVAGWRYLIEFAATISMGLGILNFLPIPMVDGGRLMFIFIEFIRGGRRIAPRKEAMVHLVGFAVMIMLFVVIAYFDTARWIRGDSLLQ
jgi:regulator of sigma E protease